MRINRLKQKMLRGLSSHLVRADPPGLRPPPPSAASPSPRASPAPWPRALVVLVCSGSGSFSDHGSSPVAGPGPGPRPIDIGHSSARFVGWKMFFGSVTWWITSMTHPILRIWNWSLTAVMLPKKHSVLFDYFRYRSGFVVLKDCTVCDQILTTALGNT